MAAWGGSWHGVGIVNASPAFLSSASASSFSP
jgi:hypothetical protein